MAKILYIKYLENGSKKLKKTASVFIPHYGCRYDCVFCNQVKISGMDKKFDYERARQDILRDIGSMDEGVTPEIAFFGGSFTAIDEEVQENCLSMANEIRDLFGGNLLIKMSTRPDAIDKNVIDRLKRYKVDTVELGVQSMDDEVLLAANRGHNSQDVYAASYMIKEAGIELGHQIMVGLPKDTEQKLHDTVEKVLEIRPNIARIYPVLVIKDTQLENMCKSNKYKALSVAEAVRLSAYVYKKFTDSGINIIRTGLQATDNINIDKDVVAGPFHSAFGELVINYLLRQEIERVLIGEDFIKKKLVIRSPKSYISKIIGNKKSNVKYFKEKYDAKLIVLEDNNNDYINVECIS